ncbi:hypothetical protein CEUSTIGMA_g1342.t1 [Chlamydomonas eustigma]|uniref:triose-phosphate isomerase n=1 Tax=Chlamydomonas eustigma TaxID=1157962 RepID=A0A250WTA8_9CHLO|nr:hypothetical protein CEUSTIGMA_g1342.t1 [Chlamydomonas eustigma]|eukprot:GAX73892.1 hypothetical protein CEUSTIGMA_g1342.t1 [Chlamydomonas eustigma]
MLGLKCNAQARNQCISCSKGVRARRALICNAASNNKFFVGGNWKSNGTKESIKDLVAGLNAADFDPKHVEVVVAPTFVHLDYVNSIIDKNKFAVSSQNIWIKGTGAFTGEIAAETLQDLGIHWVITGHSERRALCNETNDVVGLKTARALELGLNVIPCVGETLEQRQSGQIFSVLDAQMKALFDRQAFIAVKDWSKVVIAYEPVWAIGTGVVATPEQAQEVHAYLRKVLGNKLGAEVASSVRILYGGSVNDKNCEELAQKEDVDGFLVGGASLQAASFETIIKAHAASR